MRHLLFLSVLLAPTALVLSCSSVSTAPPLGDCTTCTFRPGQIIVASGEGGGEGSTADAQPAADSGTPDTGTPDTGTPDTGTPDTGTQ